MTEPAAPTEPDDDHSVAAPVRRASTLTAIAGMTGIAVLVCAGLVVWMRTGAPAEATAPETGMETEVPTELVDGIPPADVPAEIGAAVDDPVVAAVVLSELPQGLDGCSFGEVVAPELERAYALPGAVVLSMVGEPNPDFFGGPMPMSEPPLRPPPMDDEGGPVPGVEPVPPPPPGEEDSVVHGVEPTPVPPDVEWVEPHMSRWRETCVAREGDGGWSTDLHSTGPADEGGGHGFGASMTCCEDGFATALMVIDVPDEAAWVLQDRGVYWLAYPVEAVASLPLTWRYRETSMGRASRSTHVLILDPGGQVVEDRFIDV